jgi:chaperonin GroEL (HSP60 family)
MTLQAVTAGANPIAVKKGIDKTQEYLVQKLRENAKPVNGRNDIRVGIWHATSIYACILLYL